MEQEIREALEKATKGPWVTSSTGYGITDYAQRYTLLSLVEYNESGEVEMVFENHINNRHLIANTPTYLEWCLSQIAELRKENERLKKYVMWSEMRYRHYKGGIYTVIAEEAKHSETGEMDVVYANEIGDVWIRPYQMFHGFTEDGRKRFELIDCPEGTEATE